MQTKLNHNLTRRAALAALVSPYAAQALVQPGGFAAKSVLRAPHYVGMRGGSEGATSFTPASIPGLQLWLDASQIVGLNDGDPVATWSDLSGVGNHLTQSIVSSRPTYSNTTSPCVIFDGVDDWLENLTFTGGYTPEVFCRLEVVTAAASGLAWSTPDNGYFAGTYATGSGNFGSIISSGSVVVQGALALNTVGVVRIYYARNVGANTAKFAINGTEQSFTIAAGDYLAATFNKINLGRFPAGGHYQNCKIRQFLVYSSPLTAAQRLQVEAYLNALP